jgi:hypothetical protein
MVPVALCEATFDALVTRIITEPVVSRVVTTTAPPHGMKPHSRQASANILTDSLW